MIAFHLEQEVFELMNGEIELGEGYFCGVRKGKRVRETGGQNPVFGLLKRNGKVHAFPIPNARNETLLCIIRQSIKPVSIVYMDSFAAYDIQDFSKFDHERMNHPQAFMINAITSMELKIT